MYIAMNRFRITPGREDEFVSVWRERKSYLADTAGFLGFKLLRGERGETETLFISHSEWASQQAFVDWTNSEEFTRAHRQGRTPEGLVMAHPDFEGYDVAVGNA